MTTVELPTDRGELQDAVDAARCFLSVESARAYGLIEGGPDVDVDACERILEHGRSLGVVPSEHAFEEFARELGANPPDMPPALLIFKHEIGNARIELDVAGRVSETTRSELQGALGDLIATLPASLRDAGTGS